MALIALGLASAAVPYLDSELGMELGAAHANEVADHVVPGAAIAIAAAVVLAAGRRGASPGGTIVLAAASGCFLLSLWVTATHLPLVVDAAGGDAEWGASIFHSVLGPPMLALSAWVLWGSWRAGSRA